MANSPKDIADLPLFYRGTELKHLTTEDRLPVDALSSKSLILGQSGSDYYIGKFGFSNTNSADTEKPLWENGNTLTILDTADTFDITYNSTTDGEGTTGAHSLLFEYLDGDLDRVTDVIHTLGSDGNDTTSFSGIGLNRVAVLSSGTAGVNTNDITISASTGGSTQAFVPALAGVTEQLVYHFPRLCKPIITEVDVKARKTAGGQSPRVDFYLNVYSRFVETQYEIRRYFIDTSLSNKDGNTTLIPLSGQDVVWLSFDSDTANTRISGAFSAEVYYNI